MAGAELSKEAAQAIAAAPEVKSFFMFSLQDLFAASRDRVKLGHSVRLSSVQIGTGCSTVQSPPVIETMPRGSAASTPEVAAAGLTRIVLPARNRRDYDDIPAGAREKLEFVGQTRGCRVGEWSAPRVGDATQTEQSSVTARPTRPTPARRDRSVTKPALRSRSGAFCGRASACVRVNSEFRRSQRHSAGLFMLRLNLSNSAATTTRSNATE